MAFELDIKQGTSYSNIYVIRYEYISASLLIYPNISDIETYQQLLDAMKTHSDSILCFDDMRVCVHGRFTTFIIEKYETHNNSIIKINAENEDCISTFEKLFEDMLSFKK